MKDNLRYLFVLIVFGCPVGAIAGEPGEIAPTGPSIGTGLGLLWECLPSFSIIDGEKASAARAQSMPAMPVQLRVSREFLERCVSEPIVSESAIEDEILGTTITGPAKTVAKVSIVLMPDPECGVAVLTFEGNVESKTKGVHGPVVLYNDAQTEFTIQKRLVLDARGLRLEPMHSTADTDSQTTSIDSRLPGFRSQIARRVAAQRATTLREEADKIAADHTLVKLDAELTAKLGALTDPVKASRMATVLSFCNLSPDREARFRSTEDYIEITLHRRDAHAAPVDVTPPTIVGAPAIAARVHRELLRTALLDPQLRSMLTPLLAGTMNGGAASGLNTLPGSETHTLRIEWSLDKQWLLVEAHAPVVAR